MTDHIEITDKDRVRTILMNRPKVKNAITQAMYSDMADAIFSAQTDKSIRVVMITGEGDVFTSGNDLGDFMAAPPDINAEELPPVHRFLKAMLEAEKPLIGIVNGLAIGVGATMLLHCDFVYAARSATISAPFVDLGVVPEAASSLLLPMMVGPRRAAEIFMLGARMEMDEALQCGLVTRVFDDAHLLKEAELVAQALASKAPSALRETKKLMKLNIGQAETRMLHEAKLFGDALRGEEFGEAVASFMQKRAANFDRF